MVTFQLVLFLSTLSLALAQICHTEILVNNRKGLKGRRDKKFTGNHVAAGLTRECIETNVPVEKKCSDIPYIKCKKIELLSSVCTVASTSAILNELEEYATDDCVLVAAAAIKAIASVGVRLALSTKQCVQRLVPLLKCRRSHLVSKTLVALTKIAMSCDGAIITGVVPHLPSSVLSVSEPEGRAALIWLLGEHAMSLNNVPYILEEVVEDISSQSSIVKCQLITSVTKMFLRRPPECQEMLGRLLESCINSEQNVDVRDRALLYYRLLQLDFCHIERVVNCKGSVPKSALFSLPQFILQLPLCEFNTLAVMNGKTSSAFVQQVCPYTVAYGPSSKENALHWTSGIGVVENMVFQSKQTQGVQNSLCDILLDPLAKMCANEFQAMWLEMTTVRKFKSRLASVPTVDEFSKILQSQSIKTIACGSINSSINKMYFYAKHVLTHQTFLVEISIALETALLSFTLKCQDHKQATTFVKLFFETLEISIKQYHQVQWRACEDIPTRARNIRGILFEQNLCLGGGFSGSSKADSVVYVYSPELNLWKLLPSSPLQWFTIVEFDSQIVLVGGKEIQSRSSEYTNKLATWDCTNGQWNFLLPAMLNRRMSPIALSYAETLVVAGGNMDVLDYSVEVLKASSQQWQSVTQLPLSCSSPNVYFNDHWYFYRESDNSIIRIHMKALISSLPDENDQAVCGKKLNAKSSACMPNDQHYDKLTDDVKKWEKFCQISFTPDLICSIQSNLVAMKESSNGLSVFVCTPQTNTWRNIGVLPGLSSIISFISTHNSDMFFIGGDSHSSFGSRHSSKLSMMVIGAAN